MVGGMSSGKEWRKSVLTGGFVPVIPKRIISRPPKDRRHTMSVIEGRWDTAIGRHDGERARVGSKASQVVITPNESRQIRQGEMLHKRLMGWPTRAIARHYKIKICHVNNEIRDIPEWMREEIEGRARRGY